MISKLCSGCKTEKTLAQFYRNIGNKDGHSYKCKMCKDVQAKVYRENNREKVAAMKAAQQVNLADDPSILGRVICCGRASACCEAQIGKGIVPEWMARRQSPRF